MFAKWRERLKGDETQKLAEQLPEEMSTYFKGREGQIGSTLTLKDFYQRVSEKEGIDPGAAVTHVRAVFAVLNSAVIPADFSDVQASLSEDYEELFAASSIES